MGHLNRSQVEFIFFTEKTIRTLFNLDYNAHTNEYFELNFIIKCNETYKITLCCYLYKMLKGRNNDYFHQYRRTHSEPHNYSTRNNSYLIIPRFNLSTSHNSFVFQSIKSWNSLQLSIKNSSNIRIFKLKLKKYFCSEIY